MKTQNITNNLINKLISQLPPASPVVEIHPWTKNADAEIVLGGIYDGCRIQVGISYYVVAAEDINDGIVQIDGKGDLIGEINKAIGAL
jgi:hypothetical protein